MSAHTIFDNMPTWHRAYVGPADFRGWRPGAGMIPPSERHARLLRMEEARRKTQHQLDIIDRQIIRRMTALIPAMMPKRTAYRGGKPPNPRAFLERYRASLAAITAERQPEIDALSRKLARQDQAIAILSGIFQHGRHDAVPVIRVRSQRGGARQSRRSARAELSHIIA